MGVDEYLWALRDQAPADEEAVTRFAEARRKMAGDPGERRRVEEIIADAGEPPAG